MSYIYRYEHTAVNILKVSFEIVNKTKINLKKLLDHIF
jgi:hypothetical protein